MGLEKLLQGGPLEGARAASLGVDDEAVLLALLERPAQVRQVWWWANGRDVAYPSQLP